MIKAIAAHFRNLCPDERGTVALIVAGCTPVMLLAVGAAIDLSRQHTAYSRAQQNLDTALIAAVSEIGSDDKDKIISKLKAWYSSQQRTGEAPIEISDIQVSLDDATVTATVEGSIPTSFVGLVGMQTLPIKVASSAKGGDRPYLQVLYALDKSASMLLIDDLAQQRKMQDEVGCAFACHESEGRVRDTQYFTFYDYAKSKGYHMRINTANAAIRESLPIIKAADPNGQRIKVGLYKIGSDAERVLPPTYDVNEADRRLQSDAYGLTEATTDKTTYFNRSLQTLANSVGGAGDGHSEATPKKFVIIVTDGVQAEQDWVHHHQDMVAPLNPRWCDKLKYQGATVAVLYTRYLAMWWDWGYEKTVGASMASANWNANWGGVMRPGVSSDISRHDYIPMAVEDCASAKNLFLAAEKPDEVKAALKQLLKTYLSVPRLTR